MRAAIKSAIVTWDVPVSYWPIFSHTPLRKLTRPRLFFFSMVTNCNGAFHLSELTGQTIPVVMRISLFLKTIQSDLSNFDLSNFFFSFVFKAIPSFASRKLCINQFVN